MKKIIFIAAVLFLGSCSVAPKKEKTTNSKLVVGIVVDQMRYDYLTRFESKYGTDGFKRLMNDGFNCHEHHYSYMPTFTGPGHASIFSGTTPKTHGIIANDWYDKTIKKSIYCVEDSLVKGVGGKNEDRSPRNMLVTGLGDQIKLQTSNKGKSIGISIKDRAAILPAGKLADAAYWFKGGKDGNFVSSTYYMTDLPNWVNDFNAKELPKSYLSQNWETILPIDQYTESSIDNNPNENSLKKGHDPVFPYNLSELFPDYGYDLIKKIPFGNNLLVDFAKEVILNENLGKDDVMDFLSVSFSSTDYVGHNYGPKSVEIEDTYIRLDKSIAELLAFLDKEVGKNQYTVFLTADHGVAQIPQDLMDQGVEVGYYSESDILESVDNKLVAIYNQENLIESFSNFQFFINHDLVNSLNLDAELIEKQILAASLEIKSVKSGLTRRDLLSENYSYGVNQKVQKGWNTLASGDVALIMEPGWLPDGYAKNGGSSHGSPWAYDTHVPLLFFGVGINNGSTLVKTEVEDIVPTISAAIGVQAPMGSTGLTINDVVAK